jgi:hypothetical protein
MCAIKIRVSKKYESKIQMKGITCYHGQLYNIESNEPDRT